MTRDLRKRLIIVIASLVISVLVLLPTFIREGLPKWWPSQPIRLGLDLKGGVYLLLGVKSDEAVKSQVSSIATSINSELKNQKASVIKSKAISNTEIEVTFLGDKGKETLDEILKKEYPYFRFIRENTDTNYKKYVYEISDLKVKEIKELAVEQSLHTIRNRVDSFGVAEPTIQRSGKENIIVQLPDVSDIETVRKTIGSVAKLEFSLVANGSSAEKGIATKKMKSKDITEGELEVEDEILLGGEAIQTASAEFNPQTNNFEVMMKFNGVGARTFERITGENKERRLAIILDGIVQSAPVINERIPGGNAQISGTFTSKEATQLAIVLRSGALPASLTFEEERVVGATLGADSIRTSIQATLIGTAFVIFGMIVYYKKSGAVAVFCLLFNVVYLLAFLSIFGATLTLPGIAGLGLTIGMAVDANVLLFERMREEMRLGASGKAVIEAGFNRAHWTIMDSNLTTLLSGIILYQFGTGPIKGFAVTMSIGIVTTLISALFVCKVFMELLPLKDKNSQLSV